MIRKKIIKPIKKWVKKKIENVSKEVIKDEGAIKVPILYFPYQENSNSYYIPKDKEPLETCELGLPIPPKSLWLGYNETKEGYLLAGKTQLNRMFKIIEESGYDYKGKKRILDFGCGAGRMIRWIKPYIQKFEAWGTDISSEHIYWANKYLKPPFNFATTTTIPHLPFEDRYFDIVYCGSVFTHIDDLTDAWLLELRRILSKNGMLFVTLHDKHSIKLLYESNKWKNSWLAIQIKNDNVFTENKDNFGMISVGRGPESQIFYDLEYFYDSVKNIFEVISVNEEMYGYQTAVLLKKID